MTRPAVSPAAERMYSQLRAFQGGDEDSGWMLLHVCEGFARMLAKCTDALRADDIGSGFRRMHDPDRAAAWALPYLAQKAGIGELPAGLTEQQQRDLIRSAPGLRRGTRAALIGAAQRYLTGNKSVIVSERDGDAYSLTVLTLTAETPDPSATEAAIRSQKPAGLILTYAVVSGATWASATGTWDAAAAGVTWDNPEDL